MRRRKGGMQIDPSAWGLRANEHGGLEIKGCDTADLARAYGTPLYVVDASLLEAVYHNMEDAFSEQGIPFEIFYSYKTNPIPGVLKILHSFGAGAEVISPFELFLALELGVDPNWIIYNGVNKTPESLETAVEKRIKLINVNSFGEIEHIRAIAEKLGLRAKVGARVCTSVGWGGQFGFKIRTGEALRAFELLREKDVFDVECFHFHLGTNIKDPAVYARAIDEVLNFRREVREKLGFSIPCLDIGGGFGVPTVYQGERRASRMNHIFRVPFDPPNVDGSPSIKQFADAVGHAVREASGRHGMDPPMLFLEPGRCLTSSAQMVLTRVGEMKVDVEGFPYTLVDSGVNNSLPITWEYHEIFAAGKMNLPPSEMYAIAGPTCSTSDVLCRSKKLPQLEVGDLLAIMDAGAYFSSFSYNFSFPKPAVALVKNGRWELLRERETYRDMVSLDRY
jgi:diaminopimelate decarboxylase